MPSSAKILSVVVRCKDCNLNIPSGVETLPAQAIAVKCPLCTRSRYYLPFEVFIGAPSSRVSKALQGR